MFAKKSEAKFEWRKLTDRSEFPPGLADLIVDAWVLVSERAEYVGLFIMAEGKCWIGYKSDLDKETKSAICPDPDTGKKRAETVFLSGLAAPRRASRFH